ncbi:MAG TPA: hypothetical protein ENI81_03285, partial [Phycisphaerales bacterium]|nr:hypothetical protein [Phycisphaerales bacterium]
DKFGTMLRRRKKIVTVEDHAVACGFGSTLLELAVAKGCRPNNMRLLGAPRRFVGHNSRDAQFMEAGIDADSIAETVRKILKA